MGCTPLFLNAEPQVMGVKVSETQPLRRPSRISASDSSSPPRYFSMSASSVSATISIIFSRHSLAVSTSSAGISP